MSDRLRRGLLVVALALLAACGGGPSAQRRGELAQLAKLLPGEYDNLDQVRAAAPGSAPPAVRLVIVPIYAPLVGSDIFYLQEMAADDPRRVTAQRLMNLEITADGTLLQGVIALKEPARWRDGHLRPDLFKSLLPGDLRLVEGCDVRWRTAGRGFRGANDPKTCRVAQPGSGRQLHQESQLTLDDDGLASSDVLIDDAGHRIPEGDAWLRFRRRSQ